VDVTDSMLNMVSIATDVLLIMCISNCHFVLEYLNKPIGKMFAKTATAWPEIILSLDFSLLTFFVSKQVKRFYNIYFKVRRTA